MRSPEYWRDRAEEARTMASEMIAEERQTTLLNIAGQYELLAQLAEQEEARGPVLTRFWASAFSPPD